MPAIKYVCEFCDKTFADTPASRRRHLQGAGHQRNKRLWYDAFKEPCQRWLYEGKCPLGPSCGYAHPPKATTTGASPSVTSGDYGLPPTVAALLGEASAPPLESQQGHQTQPFSTSSDGNQAAKAAPLHSNLPPSLRPPPVGGYSMPPAPVDWG